jgi:hypothetical protein
MTDLSTSVTTTMKDEARTAIRAILKESDPTLDISTGGVVDSVIVEGNVVVTANNQAEVNQAYLYQQLKAIAEGTVTIEDSALDALMTNYYLTRNQAVQSTGTVEFVVQLDQAYVFNKGYTVRVGGLAYSTTATYSVYPTTTTTVDFTVSTNIQIFKFYDAETGYVYRFRIPVTANVASEDYNITAGTRLVADQGFVGLGYVQAVTNFTGGSELETNAEFATRALEGITATTLGGGQDHVQACVGAAYTGALSSAVGVESTLMTRSRGNIFNISTGGYVDVYAKSGATASNTIIKSAVVTDFTTHTAAITLTREQSVGVYRVQVIPRYTSTPPVITAGNITQTAVTHNVATLTGYNANVTAAIDLAFSANESIVITFTDTRQTSPGVYVVPMTSNGQTVSGYAVAIESMPGIIEIADSLYSTAIRPAGLDVLVKAAVPCVTTLTINAVKPVNYNGPSATQLTALIAASVNELPMRQKYLDAFTISNILKQRSSTLQMQSVTMSGVIYGQDGSNINVTMLGDKLTIPTSLTAKVSYENTFFATQPNLVTVNLA